MRTIREVREEELETFLRITIEAFPGMKVISPEEKQRQIERLSRVMKEPAVHFFALYEDDEMRGVMRLYDFKMKLRSARTLVGGVGGVAVDLRHKKEKVAADMIRFFLRYYREKGACMTALYPFRPDFYRQMGFGYGAKMNRYSFRPAALPATGDRTRVDYLSADDKEALRDCYDRMMERTNGLIEFLPHVLDSVFTDPALKVVGYRGDGGLTGYLVFRFEPAHADNFLSNNLVILRGPVYDDTEALLGLLSFLRSQADQVERVIIETQDDAFPFLLTDPRNGTGNMLAGLWHETNTQGMGIMYRVVDVPRLFNVLSDHDFGGISGRLRLVISDSFMPDNGGAYTVLVEDGRARLVDDAGADVEVGLNVAEFSSLMAGSVGFGQLHEYGLATISDPRQLPLIERFFYADRKPLCMTGF